MKAIYRIDAETSKIELTQGHWAMVDNCDVPQLEAHSWCLRKAKRKLYAKAQIERRTVYMHRLLVNPPVGSKLVADHRNGDGLDNRRSNLRLATVRQNARNSPGAAGRRRASVRGVSRRMHLVKPFRAYLYDDEGRFLHLGYYATEEEAAERRIATEQEVFGEYSWHEQEAAA